MSGGIAVVVPTRSRPPAARATIEAIRATAVLVSTVVILGVDADDPCAGEYRAPAFGGQFGPEVAIVTLREQDTGNLVRASNTIARRVAAADPTAIIGNLGDDHRTRTPRWDAAVAAALVRPGIAYGDDLIHGERLPSAPFVSASIVAELGWFFPAFLEHMYVDDALRELGRAAGVLTYLPDVVIEHCHPDVGKGEWDELYRRTNAPEAMARDQERFEAWLGGPEFGLAVNAVRRVANT
jgi:hypothetical protein